MHWLLTFVLAVGINHYGLSFGATCPIPPTETNYTNGLYEGPWYEIGKIQTTAGAIFEHECVCTVFYISFVDLKNETSSATITNVCFKYRF